MPLPESVLPLLPLKVSRFPLKGGISLKLGKVKGAETSPATGTGGGGGGGGGWARARSGGGATLPSCPAPSPLSAQLPRPPLLAPQMCALELEPGVCVCVCETLVLGGPPAPEGEHGVEERKCHASGVPVSDIYFVQHMFFLYPLSTSIPPRITSVVGTPLPTLHPGTLRQIPLLLK